MTQPSAQVADVRGRDGTDVSLETASARKKLESAATLHWIHWLIISLSLVLTFFAWSYASSVQEARVALQFERDAEQVIELVHERMQKYEDALWGGVALIDTSGGNVSFDQWNGYANSLHIEKKYPGINGIGVIHALERADEAEFIKNQRVSQPGFRIFPPHESEQLYPISYIVPLKGNEQAVGLDMAHEKNRFAAAKKSRDTGTAQITGPITLVQDSGKTPGFLFYAPFYEGGKHSEREDRVENFSGMVYAPFVVQKLMLGTLDKQRRRVGVRLIDEGEVLYDEHVDSEEDYDPNPLHQQAVDVPMYGRVWTFDIWSAKSFRDASVNHQPLFILIGGIAVDAMLLFLFVMISRSAHRSLRYADSMTVELASQTQALHENKERLAARARQLQQSNSNLERFAYVASHDLQEPLRKVSSFCQLLKQEYGSSLDDDANTYIDYAVNGAKRMKTLIGDLLSFSRINAEEKNAIPTDAAESLSTALYNLHTMIAENHCVVTTDDLPVVMANNQLARLFQNLVGNGIKYRDEERIPEIHIGATTLEGQWVFSVSDNGIGIGEEYFESVFDIFRRLHAHTEYTGTGIGLAICKTIVEGWNGRLWVESQEGVGSTFYFTADPAPEVHFPVTSSETPMQMKSLV